MFGKNSHSNTDGFVIKRRTAPAAKIEQSRHLASDPLPEQILGSPQYRSINAGAGLQAEPKKSAHRVAAASVATAHRTDITKTLQSLPSVDLNDEPAKKKRFRLSKKTIKRFLIAVMIVVLLVGGYVGIKFLIASGRVFSGNLFSALINDGKELKKDQYGRVNILIFGTSEDDVDHDGADLTDSIMVASINPADNTGFLMSVPRDLWVKYGKACSSGYEGRINVLYQCGKDGGDSKSGAQLLEGVVEDNFGIDIKYHVNVNYSALRQAVDAVDGITVQIESDDPRGIYDPNFDWQCNHRCNLVKYPNGPANLNGERALALARARNAAGGYGLGGGNFDREQYQQKIIIALKDKATSAGVLANPVTVTKLLDSLGDNVRTNFDAGEIKTLIKLAQQVDAKQLKRLSLVDEKKPLVTTANISGQSVVRPVTGVYDFSDIRAMLRVHLSGDNSALEGATIDVLNGSGIPGQAQTKADELEEQGYNIATVGNAPGGTYGTMQLYDLSDGKKPATKAKLQKALGVSEVKSSDLLPAGAETESDFVIIIGTNGSH